MYEKCLFKSQEHTLLPYRIIQNINERCNNSKLQTIFLLYLAGLDLMPAENATTFLYFCTSYFRDYLFYNDFIRSK